MSPCPSEITVAGFAEGELSAPERRGLEAHLDACPDCRELVARLVKTESVTCLADLTNQGDRVGRYQLRKRIGGGAMGVVYEAYDPELARRVALKLLRTGQEGTSSSRLLREAQSMARLSHPNVVAVHDVGEDRGEVFLVMDYVEGGSLTDWLRAAPRSWQEVLELYLAAGRGLEAAHQIGLVHRDFKPDNVVVGNDGRVGITDFGLAALAAGDQPIASNGSPRITQTGLIMGTPIYMAPEVHAGEPADERSDLFSFCVSLYEGLLGQRPYVGSTIAELAHNKFTRAIQPKPPDSPVPADVLASVVRGLAPEPGDRPGSITDLIAELAAHLSRERPRRRWRAAVLAILASITAASAVWSTVAGDDPCADRDQLLTGVWDASRRSAVRDAFAAISRPYAPRLAVTVEQRVDGYARAWLRAARGACVDTHVRRVQSEAVMDRQMDCLKVRRRELDAFAELLTRVDADSALKLGQGAFELADVESCADSTLVERVSPPAPAVAPRVQRLREEIGEARARLHHDPAEARARLAKLVEEVRALGYGPLVAEALLDLGRALEHLGQYRAAEESHLAAAAEAVASRHDEAAANAWIELVYVVGYRLMDVTRASQWIPLADAALASLGRPPAMVARLHWRQGDVLATASRFQEAVPVLEQAVRELGEAFGPEDPTVAAAMLSLGMVLMKLGKTPEAARLLERARQTTEAHWGPANPQVAAALLKLGIIADDAAQPAKAIALYQQALDIRMAAFGPEHPDVAHSHINLGGILPRVGDLDGAIAHLETALAIQTKVLGPDHPDLGATLVNLGNVHTAREEYDAALDYYRRGVDIEQRMLGRENVAVADTLHNVATVLTRLHRYAEGLEIFRQVAAIYEKAYGPNHTQVAVTHSAIGDTLLDLGRIDEGLAAHERAVAIYERNSPGRCQHYQAYLQASLAQALWRARRERRRSQALMQSSLACLATIDDPDAAADREMLAKWAREHPWN